MNILQESARYSQVRLLLHMLKCKVTGRRSMAWGSVIYLKHFLFCISMENKLPTDGSLDRLMAYKGIQKPTKACKTRRINLPQKVSCNSTLIA